MNPQQIVQQQANESVQEQMFNFGYQGGQSTASALQWRLDVSPVKNEIKAFLQGCYVEQYIDPKTQTMRENLVKFGEPLANQMGIQCILAEISSIFNSHLVMGNTSEDMYYNYVNRLHERIAVDIMDNLTKMGIEEHNYSLIIGCIIDMVEIFLTRTLQNGERDSMTPTIKSIETSNNNQMTQTSGGFKMPWQRS